MFILIFYIYIYISLYIHWCDISIYTYWNISQCFHDFLFHPPKKRVNSSTSTVFRPRHHEGFHFNKNSPANRPTTNICLKEIHWKVRSNLYKPPQNRNLCKKKLVNFSRCFNISTRWWFQIFYIFTPTCTWGDDATWRAYVSNGSLQAPGPGQGFVARYLGQHTRDCLASWASSRLSFCSPPKTNMVHLKMDPLEEEEYLQTNNFWVPWRFSGMYIASGLVPWTYLRGWPSPESNLKRPCK